MDLENFVLVALIMAIIISMCGSIGFRSYTCATRAGEMEMPFKYGPVMGCMVKAKLGWIPLDQYRVVE